MKSPPHNINVEDPLIQACRDVYCAADDVVYKCKTDKNNVTK